VLILENVSTVREPEQSEVPYLFLAAAVAAVGAFLFFVPSCCERSRDNALPPKTPLSDLSIATPPAPGFSALLFFTTGAGPDIPRPDTDSAAISPTLLDFPFMFTRLAGRGSSKSESTWFCLCLRASIASLRLSLRLAMSVSCMAASPAAASLLELATLTLVGGLLSIYAQCVKLPNLASSETSPAM